MNSSKDIVCKLISHIPVIMVTLGDKGLLVCIMYMVYYVICIIYIYRFYELETFTVRNAVGLKKKNTKKKQNSFVIKISKRCVFVLWQLASRQSDDTVSLVHYPAQKIETPVSASGAGDWYVPIPLYKNLHYYFLLLFVPESLCILKL